MMKRGLFCAFLMFNRKSRRWLLCVDLRRPGRGNWKEDICSCLGTSALWAAALLGCWGAVGVRSGGCIAAGGLSPIAPLGGEEQHHHGCLRCLLGWTSLVG